MTRVRPGLIAPFLMVLLMIISSAVVPFMNNDVDTELSDDEETATSGRVTGNESISFIGVSSWYSPGSTVWVTISSSNLDPNTNYTLEYGPALPWWGGGILAGWSSWSNFSGSGGTSWNVMKGWATLNSSNNTQVLWNNSWRIHANLYAQPWNGTGAPTLLNFSESTTFAVGTSGYLSSSYSVTSPVLPGTNIASTISAFNCFYDIDNGLEYEWTGPNGNVIYSYQTNFSGESKHIYPGLSTSLTTTPGYYTQSISLYQQAVLIDYVQSSILVVSVGSGYEYLTANVQSTSYSPGELVWAYINATNLDPNTNYTLEWGPSLASESYILNGWTNSVNFTGVTNYSFSHNWSTFNYTNNSVQIIWNSSWQIQANLLANNNSPNLLLNISESIAFAVGTGGYALANINSNPLSIVGWNVAASVYANSCFYDIDNRLEYEWTDQNGTVLSSGGYNFMGTYSSLSSNLPTSAQNTAGNYTLTARLYQQGSLISSDASTHTVIPMLPGTGNENVSVSVPQSSYIVGDTLTAYVTASNLDPNTNYTLDTRFMYDIPGNPQSTNTYDETTITGVTNYNYSISWLTGSEIGSGDWLLQAHLWSLQSNFGLAWGYSSSFTISNATGNGGNNTGNNTDCLSNNTPTGVLTDLFVWTDNTLYNVGETTVGSFFVNCTVIGEYHQLYYEIVYSNGNIIDWGFINWTATQNSWMTTTNWNLPEHQGYYLNVDLTSTSFGMMSVDYEEWGPFSVIGNNTQPGGGNNTDCLSNNTPTGVLTELFVWTDSVVYNVGETTIGTFFVNCTVIGEDYELYYEIEDSNGVIMDSGWWNWTATQSSWIMTMNWNLPEHMGYCLTGTLSMSGVWIDHNPWCPFDVIGNNTQPGGGNNTGGNNSGNQSDCGTLNNLTELEATLYNSPFYVWESISSNWVGICTVIGQDYMLEAFLEDDASTITVPSQIYWMDWYNFTATSSWEFIGNAIFTGLNPGGYCIDSTLYEMPGEVFVDYVYSCFTVLDYPTGGNNSASGNSSSNPILPGNTTNNSGNTTFNFEFTVNWGEPVFVDPFVAIGYDYEISDGPNFASVMIPFDYGDGMFDIYLWDGTAYAYTGISIATGTHYSFQSGGVDRFSIRGIEVSAEVDPDDPEGFVTSLTFVNSGDVDMVMVPVVVWTDDEVPCTDDCPELVSGDTDGDGVPNEWDDCPGTAEGVATDSNGCEVITTETTPPVDDGNDGGGGGGGLPGFTSLLTVTSLVCIALLRPLRRD